MKIIYEHTADKNLLSAWSFYKKIYTAMAGIISAVPIEYACHFFFEELDTDTLVEFTNALFMKSRYPTQDNVYVFKINASTEDGSSHNSYCCWFALNSDTAEREILKSIQNTAIGLVYNFYKTQPIAQE